MASAARDINWRYFGDALPSFVTLAVMPFTYSIAYGLIAGIITYIFINTATWLIELASGGRLITPDKEYKEPWTYKIKGGLLPAWVVRASKGFVRRLKNLPPTPPSAVIRAARSPVFQNYVMPSSTVASIDVDIEMDSQPSLSPLRRQSSIMPPPNPENSQRDFWHDGETVQASSSEAASHDGIERVMTDSDQVEVKHEHKGNDEKLT